MIIFKEESSLTLTAAIRKWLGSVTLRLYAGVTFMFLPISAENQPAFVTYLEANTSIKHPLSSATCEFYHCYGMFLAPLNAALKTVKHYQFGHQWPRKLKDDGEPTDGKSDGPRPSFGDD